LHGHRYARFRGLAKVQAQCLLSAACQNMKKIALLLTRRAAALFSPKFWLCGAPTGTLRSLYAIFTPMSPADSCRDRVLLVA